MYTAAEIQALLHPTTKPGKLEAVLSGLNDGSLYQDGGVIRRGFPQQRRGQIFAHLYQNGIADEASPLNWGTGVTQGLAVLNTALSAVNLGVSIAGFAILASKISALDRSIRALEAGVASGFKSLEGRLDAIEHKINGLADLVVITQEQTWSEVQRVRTQIDLTMLAKLRAAVENLIELEQGRKAGRDAALNAEELRVVRAYLAGVVAEIRSHGPVLNPAEQLRLRGLLMALGQSVQAEAFAWRLSGETESACRTITAALPEYRANVQALASDLLGDVAVMGLDHPITVTSTRSDCLVPAVLLDAQYELPPRLVTRLTTRWATYVDHEPQAARRLVNQGQAAARAKATLNLLRPVCEATVNLSGLGAEYAALASARVRREDWELQQVRSDRPALVIREPIGE